MSVDYDTWKMDYTAYDYPYIGRKTDRVDVQGLRDYFEEIIDALYSNEKLDIPKLEDRLFWIGEELGITTPDDNLKIQKII